MVKTILKRIIQLIPILFIVSTIIFVITRMIPGDPAKTMLGPQAPVEAVEELREELGLNKSIGEQYLIYLKDVTKGDFGKSYAYNEPVMKLILERFPNTLILTVVSLCLAMLVAIPIGIISATRQYSIFDYVSMIGALVGVSMPIFWLGLMLVLVFSVNLDWLPSIGMGSLDKGLWDVIKHLILPSVCMATIPAATFARITRSSMLDVVKQDYIKSLRSKGLRESIVIWKHALKNALPPILTVIGLQVSTSLSGAILTETIFSWPGMGRMIVDAIENRDYMLIQGAVLFIAFLFVFVNLIVDILYLYVNPKVSYDGDKGGGE
ncbi:peptide/nickel transport system permease protein [Dethiosulfatibacter aminovorans DSM 17477]|uniref:Peptide/nickel transport system permease protein n=1 Tax=Dethiosulfatibacter aminovorans DSM 17477 TaxID=1121476 RepID=A0A1M6BLC8_9FIRM|nr:ABC transporter permease [Dethiosulfatibacter aminovorans]SHI49522.1 peptide/nickel transport system permease protein [Dethiosulfatibacter aminovorans DSM 17477]